MEPEHATPQNENPWVNPDGTFVEGFRDRLGESLRHDKTIAGLRDLPGALEMLVAGQKLIGEKRAVIPAGPDDKEHLDQYFRLVGWPEGPDGYPEVKADLPEGMQDDPELVQQWRQWCHEARLTPAQMQYLTAKTLEWNVNNHNLQAQDRRQTLEKATASLKSRWQNKYNINVQFANTAAAAFADEAELAHLKESGYLEDPVFLSIMHKIGQAVSPDRLNARSDGGIDKGSIRRQIDDLMHSEAYQDPKNPRNKSVTDQVAALFSQLQAAG